MTSSARAYRYTASNGNGHPLSSKSARMALACHALYGLGDWIYSIAIVILVYQIGGGLTAAAAVLLFQASGRLAGTALTPSFRVRDSRRLYRIGIGSGFARAALIACLVIVTAREQLWFAVAIAASIGILSPIAESGQRALSPIGITSGSSRSLRSRLLCRWDQLAMIAGSVAGGLLLVLWTEQAALGIAALLSMTAVALMLRTYARAEYPLPPPARTRPATELRTVRPLNPIHLLLVALAAGAALGIAIRILLVEIVIEDHGQSELMYGLFVALAGAGAFAGPLSIPRLLGKIPWQILLAGVTAALSVALIAVHLADPLPLLVPIVLVCGILAITGERTGETVVRRIVPDHELDSALRMLAIATIAGQAVALGVVASLHFLHGVALVVLSLTAISIFCALLPILLFRGIRSRSTASRGV